MSWSRLPLDYLFCGNFFIRRLGLQDFLSRNVFIKNFILFRDFSVITESYFITIGISVTLKYIFVSELIENQTTHLFLVNFNKKTSK